MRLPPTMTPALPEMRELDCWGLVKTTRPDLLMKCGRKVELACPRCGVHRCRACAELFEFCPMCPRTDWHTYVLPEVH